MRLRGIDAALHSPIQLDWAAMGDACISPTFACADAPRKARQPLFAVVQNPVQVTG
jgi:hypothetical protein